MLVGVMALTLVLSIVAIGIVMAATGESRSSVHYALAADALGLAEAALEHVYAQIKMDYENPALGLNHVIDEAYLEGFLTDSGSPTIDWDSGLGKIIDVWLERDTPRAGHHRVHVLAEGVAREPYDKRTVLAVFRFGPYFHLFEHTIASYGNAPATVELRNATYTVNGTVHANGIMSNRRPEGDPVVSYGDQGELVRGTAIMTDPIPSPNYTIHEMINEAKDYGQWLEQTNQACDGQAPFHYRHRHSVYEVLESFIEYDEEGNPDFIRYEEDGSPIPAIWYIDGDADFNGNDELWLAVDPDPQGGQSWFHFYPLFIVQGDIKITGGANVINAFFYSVEGEIQLGGSGSIVGAVATGGEGQNVEIDIAGTFTMHNPLVEEDLPEIGDLHGWKRGLWVETSEIDRTGETGPDPGDGGDVGQGEADDTSVSRVQSISHIQSGNHLDIVISVAKNGQPLVGATVFAEVRQGESLEAHIPAGVTDENGQFTYRWNNFFDGNHPPAPGAYSVVINNVVSAVVWDGITPPNSITKE